MSKTHTIPPQPFVERMGGPLPDRAEPPAAGTATTAPDEIHLRRRTVDTILIAAGTVVAIVLAVAGGLLTWGNNFANDYVGRELRSQNIVFPDAESLEAEGRTDLLKYAGEQVDTGAEAEAYASYIAGHLEETAGGLTYAELGGPQREARAALQEAIESGADQATIDELQATVDELTSQRETLFKGETLRGLLLSTYAWSTIGQIAGIAAVAAYVGAGLMVVLVVLGLIHRLRMRNAS
jgi:hypothetical protein